jgi:hypothetical protein
MTENINLKREEENLWYRKELLWIVLVNSFLIWFSVSWQKSELWQLESLVKIDKNSKNHKFVKITEKFRRSLRSSRKSIAKNVVNSRTNLQRSQSVSNATNLSRKMKIYNSCVWRIKHRISKNARSNTKENSSKIEERHNNRETKNREIYKQRISNSQEINYDVEQIDHKIFEKTNIKIYKFRQINVNFRKASYDF